MPADITISMHTANHAKAVIAGEPMEYLVARAGNDTVHDAVEMWAVMRWRQATLCTREPVIQWKYKGEKMKRRVTDKPLR